MAPTSHDKHNKRHTPRGGVTSSPKNNSIAPPPPQQQPLDPNGTVHVARGSQSLQQTKRQLQALQQTAATNAAAVHYQLEGTQSHQTQERRRALLRDDANPVVRQLSAKQQLNLQQRQRLAGGGGGNKKLQAVLQRHDLKRLTSAVAAVDARTILQTDQVGLLQPEHDLERTSAVTQVQLKRLLDPKTAKSIFDLRLNESPPYGVEYDRSGRYTLLYGTTTGHMALLDGSLLVTEFHLQERVRDACYLHNSTMLAVAQRNHVHVYDSTGAEVHRLENHVDPAALQFLPHHWLLASIGRAGWLTYQDTSTGQVVSQHRTKLGPCAVLRQNPATAILFAGHLNGTVTLWSPACAQPVVKMHCSKRTSAAIHCLAVDPTGRVMVTGGADRQVRVWDLRMYQELHAYTTNNTIPTNMDISQRGILGIGHGSHATFWSAEALRQKIRDPYMHHLVSSTSAGKTAGPVQTLRFCPFQDVCGIGHAAGMSSIVIPGAGEPTLDTAEYHTNPYQDAKQRKEADVRSLLDKLRPEMIALDTDQVGGIEASDPHTRLERIQQAQDEANATQQQHVKPKVTKKRGRSKIQTKLRRKNRNVVDQNTIKLREALEKEKAGRAAEHNRKNGASTNNKTALTETTPKEAAPASLKRFF